MQIWGIKSNPAMVTVNVLPPGGRTWPGEPTPGVEELLEDVHRGYG